MCRGTEEKGENTIGLQMPYVFRRMYVHITQLYLVYLLFNPRGDPGGFKTRIGPPYIHRRRKKRLKRGGFSDDR